MNEAQHIKKIAQNIKRLREERQLDQVQFAALCGWDKTSVNRLEAGRTSPNIKTYLKVASALEVELSELFKF